MKATIIKEFGKVESSALTLAHKEFLKGSCIPAHSHPGCDVFFTLVKGNMNIRIAGEEYCLTPGAVLRFNGENTIEGSALEDSEVFIYLVKEQ